MASSKETPRQKMIGMMYLVLTALLALQVSSAVIFKFLALNESLESSSDTQGKNNREKLMNIAQTVKDRGNSARDVKFRDDANSVSQHTGEIISYIDAIKKKLIDQTGGYDEDGNLKGAKEETEVEVMMIGADPSQGKGYELKKKLNDYVQYINKLSPIQYSKLALDGKEDPMFMNNADQKNKDFAQLNFGQTPLAAGLAVLSEFEARVRMMETTTLGALADSIDAKDYKFNKLVPVVRANSKIVPAGTKYEAEIVMSATSTSLKPEMSVDNRNLEVNEDGIGSYSFMASGGPYDPSGYAKKKWTGKIKMKKPDGKDTVYTVTEEYLVAKPVIEVRTGSLPALYRNCGNKLNVQVPALGNSYNPAIIAEGANVIRGQERGAIVVVPSGTNVSLKVSSNGNYIGEERFRVKPIPLPKFEVKVNGQSYDEIVGVPAQSTRVINVKAIADKDFKASNPEDSYYQITEWKAYIRKGKNAKAVKSYDQENGLMSQLGQLDPGDRIVVEIIKVRRKTYTGAWEEVNVPREFKQIPLY
ncbi:MAG: gliding motility protein GldM [Cytophagaceae bacterium]